MEFWNSRVHKARKQHRCEYCGKIIEPGETYSHESGKWEGEFCDYSLCMRCAEILPYMKYESEYELGCLSDDLNDNDILNCPKCGSYCSECDFSDDVQSVRCECDYCGNLFMVDLSAEAIKQYLLKERENNA